MKNYLAMLLLLCAFTLSAQQTEESKVQVEQIEDLGNGKVMVGTNGVNNKIDFNADNVPVTTGTFAGQSTRSALESINSAAGSVQSLTYNAGTQALGISGGNSVTLDVDDADASITNEAQTLSKSGTTVTLSAANGAGGGSFTDAVNDADASPTNEAQTLTRSANNMVLSAAGGAGGGTRSVADVKTTEYFKVTTAGATITISGTPDLTYEVSVSRNGVAQTTQATGSDVTFSGTGNKTLTANYRNWKVGDIVKVTYID